MKKLHTGHFLWPTYDVIGKLNCTQLPEQIQCDVIVVGAGVSGLLTAYELWRNNVNVCIVEANQVAHGSTLASTGLIQYSSDVGLTDLRARIGRDNGDSFYLASAKAVKDLKFIADLLKQEVADPHFFYRASLQYASSPDDINKITQQYNAFKSIDLPCELIGQAELHSILPSVNTEAILTGDDAELNPYLFVKYLAAFLLRQGVHIYEHAKLTFHDQVKYRVNEYIPVLAEHVIYTIGYQPEQLEEPDIHPILNRSYVIATEPIEQLERYYDKKLIWETTNPYIYARSTIDNRIMIGGLDDIIATPNEHKNEVNIKNEKLLQVLQHFFPKIKPSIAYSWNATFANSKDLLPFIGPSYTYKNRSYLCGYGGNGTVYSMIGSQLLTSYICTPQQYFQNPIAQIVKLKR